MLKNQITTMSPSVVKEMKKVLSVMVIDDDNEILESIQYALASYGQEVTVCENGAQAMMRAMMNDFDCIVTDYNLPGIDGLELAKRLRERFPIAIIIGMSLKGLRQEFLCAGADDFLQKPFDPYRLPIMLMGDDILA